MFNTQHQRTHTSVIGRKTLEKLSKNQKGYFLDVPELKLAQICSRSGKEQLWGCCMNRMSANEWGPWGQEGGVEERSQLEFWAVGGGLREHRVAKKLLGLTTDGPQSTGGEVAP